MKFKNPTKTSASRGLLSYLIALTIFFLMVEISFVIQGSGIYLGDYKFVSHHLHVPWIILPGFLFFLCAQLFLHFTYAIIIWGLMHGIALAIPRVQKQFEILGIALWLLGLITILLANQYCFPNSKFAYLTANFFRPFMVKYLFWVCSLLCFAISMIGLYGFLLALKKRLKLAASLLSLGLIASLGFASHQHPQVITDASTADKPNIILIGMDALRPDFLGFMGGTKRTPHLDNFLEQATTFSESLTPIARTFPAWTSILTGAYPKISNVRFDLEADITFDLTQTLPAILKRNGYETIFGTDETRFSNIDQRFGFDRIITPPIGFNDFFIGTLNDFPMSNLVVNSVLGKHLFPYSYANRPVYNTYDPDTFIRLLQANLSGPRNKPVFIAVHFCLPHFPYVWDKSPFSDKSLHNYQAAVNRVDQQFNDYLQLLQKNNFLKHSIVIILSDHGEAIELRGDRVTDADFFIAGKENVKKVIPHFYPASLDHEHVNQSAGHGTDVLSMTQYHNVLAMRFYGVNGQVPGIIPGRVSLIDIKPTILDALHIKATLYNGQSLVPYLAAKKLSVPENKDFFTESDFSPQSVRTVHPETRKVLFEGIDLFEINQKTARIGVKQSMAEMIISSKQFADYRGPWVLALYPQNKQDMMPILVNLETGYWTNDLRTTFAKQSPAEGMLASMEKFFGNDLRNVLNNS